MRTTTKNEPSEAANLRKFREFREHVRITVNQCLNHPANQRGFRLRRIMENGVRMVEAKARELGIKLANQ